MAITSSQALVQYSQTTVPQTFSVPFQFIAASDLAVVKTASGVDSTLLLNTDYTVAGGGDATGTVTVLGGASGNTVTIYRNADVKQPTVYTPNDALPTKTTEQTFDTVVMYVQQLLEQIKRCVRMPLTTGVLAPGAISITASTITLQANSIAALKAIAVSGVADKTNVVVSGYYAPGDGGGGQFFYDASNVGSDNGGTIIAPNSGSGRWVRVYSGPVNVRWFGAKGDGSTDDTSAINSALALVWFGSSGGLFFPKGIYLTDGINLTGRGINIFGEVVGGVGLTTGSVLKCRSSCTTFVKVYGQDFRISQLIINGNGLATNTVKYTDHTTDVVMDQVTIYGCASSGVNLNLTPDVGGTLIDLCDFYHVLIYGSPGKTNVTNMKCQNNQTLKMRFYSCQWNCNTNTEVKYNIDWQYGGAAFYDAYFQGLDQSVVSGAIDFWFRGGEASFYSGRSESQCEMFKIDGEGRTIFVNCVHGASSALTSFEKTASATGTSIVEGGYYYNVIQNGAQSLFINIERYGGATTTGTGLITYFDVNGLIVRPLTDVQSLLQNQSNSSSAGWGQKAATDGTWRVSRYSGGAYTIDAITTDSTGITRFYSRVGANLVNYASNAAAVGAGLPVGDFYRNGDNVCVVH